MRTWRVVSRLGLFVPLCFACGATEDTEDTREVAEGDDDTSNPMTDDDDDAAGDDDLEGANPNGNETGDSPNQGAPEEPNGSTEEVVNPSRAIPGVVLMDDGEDGDNALLTGDEAGFLGYWYTFDDRQECDHPDFAEGNGVVCGSSVCAASGLTTPLPEPQGGTGFTMTEYAEVDAAPAPREGEQTENLYGVRLQGGGHKSWGTGIGVGLNNPGAPSPYDLTAHGFVGVRFLARVVQPGTTVSVNITDAYSEPLGARCLDRQNLCSDTASLSCTCTGAMSQGCFDDAQLLLGNDATYPALTAEWQLYEVRFDDLARGIWGGYEPGSEPPSPALDPTQAYQLQFEVRRPSTEAELPPFELWIDNVGFLRSSATPMASKG